MMPTTMVVVSFVLAFLALMFALAGVLLSFVPYVGIACSVLSLVCSVSGIVTGAKGNADAKARGETGSAPGVAIGLNVAMFLLSLCVVSTCGACNALLTTSDRSGQFYISGPDGSVRVFRFGDDGGVSTAPNPFAPSGPSGVPPEPPPIEPPAPIEPPTDDTAPPPAMPPPPMPSP